jgi:hypothetical protein
VIRATLIELTLSRRRRQPYLDGPLLTLYANTNARFSSTSLDTVNDTESTGLVTSRAKSYNINQHEVTTRCSQNLMQSHSSCIR